MLKKIFFSFFFIFISIFFLKNSYSAEPQIIMECPGLKSFKKWCAGEYKGNETKSCIMISTPITEKGNLHTKVEVKFIQQFIMFHQKEVQG